MSGDIEKRSYSDSLVLDDSANGVVIKGIKDDIIAAKSGLQKGDEIVAATIHLDHLNKNEVLSILKVLEPYDNNIKVLTKKELGASAGLDPLGLGLKDLEIPDLKKDLSLDASSEAPGLSFDGLKGKLNAAPGLGGEIGGPSLSGDLPNLSLNTPSADGGVKFTKPALGLTGPDVKGDLDGTLQAPDVSVSTPKLNTPSASLDIDKPEIKTGHAKYKAPKFAMPNFSLPQFKTPKAEMDVSGDAALPSLGGNLETPDLNLSAPNLDLKSPDVDLNGKKMNLNGPGVHLDSPNADIQASPGKINWPNLKWKAPKFKGPNADINADVSAPDASLTTPKIDGDLSAPDVDVNLLKADIKSPNLDVQTPNLDTDVQSGRIKWPHLKLKKPKLHGPKADLDVDANLNTPNVDASLPKVEGGINAPEADINFPKADLDVQTPNADIEASSGKINWPHMRMKKPKLHGPKSDLSIDADLNVPQADLNGPSVDLQNPELDIDAPSPKINWPHLKWKKPKLHGPKADADLNADLSAADVDLSVPKVDADADLNLPVSDVGIKPPNADIEAPSGKIRFPTLKKPKFQFSGPKGKGPDAELDADVKAPNLSLSPQASHDGLDLDLNLPNADVDLKAPNVDTEVPSKKFKWPTFRKPKWQASSPKVNGPDVDADVSAPDLSLSTPKIDGGISAPDVNLNSPDLEGPELDINAPGVESPSGKLKWFNFKKPKFGTLKGSKGDIDADVKVPDVDFSAPDFSTPKAEGGIEGPDLNMSMPQASVEGPDVNLNGIDIKPDIDSPSAKLNLPNFKLPQLKGPRVKSPELDADVDAPNVDLKASDLYLSTPKIGLDAPNLDTDLPKADLKGTDVDLQAPEVDASAGKFKFPKINFPKISSSGPKVKGPDLNVDADNVSFPDMKLQTTDAKAPNLNVSSPTIKGDLSTTDLDLGADLKTGIDILDPKTNIDVPDLSLSTPKTKGPNLNLSLPNDDIKGPGVHLTKPDLQVPDLSMNASDLSLSSPEIDTKLPIAELEAPVTPKSPNVDINLPKTDIKLPDAQVKTPDLDTDSHLGDFNLPHFKLPNLGLSSPEAEVPSVNPSVKSPQVNIGTPTEDANISVPAVDLNVPKVKADIKGPEALNTDSSLEKSKWSNLKFPKLSFPGTDKKAAEVNASPDIDFSPDVKVKAPNVESEVKTSLNTPELDISAEADAGVKGSPKSKLRWPFKWGLKSGSGTDEEGSGGDSETELSNAEEVPVFKIHRLPRNSIDSIVGTDDPLSLPKLDTEAKDYVLSKGIRLPIVNTTSKPGEKIDIMQRLKLAKEKVPSLNASPTEAKTKLDLNLPAPNVDVSASPEADRSLVREGTFKVDKPESVPGLVAPEILTSDENDKLSLSLSNMLGLNIKDSDAD